MYIVHVQTAILKFLHLNLLGMVISDAAYSYVQSLCRSVNFEGLKEGLIYKSKLAQGKINLK